MAVVADPAGTGVIDHGATREAIPVEEELDIGSPILIYNWDERSEQAIWRAKDLASSRSPCSRGPYALALPLGQALELGGIVA